MGQPCPDSKRTPQASQSATDFAARLNGREYGHEITKAEELEARQLCLVVLFGNLDDNAELRGAISDEVGCAYGGPIRLHQDGILASHDPDCECPFCGYAATVKKCASIHAVWGAEGYSWTYKTAIPHATFDILEDGEKFCRGIVFNVADLPSIR